MLVRFHRVGSAVGSRGRGVFAVPRWRCAGKPSVLAGLVIYRFAGYAADSERFNLVGSEGPIFLQPKALRLLLLLLGSGGRLVTKEALYDAIWPGRLVSESAMASQVKALRRALGDRTRPYRILDTVHGQGFRIVCDIETVGTARPEPTVGEPDRSQSKLGRKASVAVLTFRVHDNSPESTFVSLGLPDEITVSLAQLPSLHVISRASTFLMPRATSDLASISTGLGADYAVTGTVRFEYERIHLTVELADTREGAIVWGDSFSLLSSGIHRQREDLVYLIANAIERAIPSNEFDRIRMIPPKELTAWQAYHAGMANIFLRGRANMEKARGFLQEAVEIDSGFARAHAGLAYYYWWEALQKTLDDDRTLTLLQQSAEAALEHAPADAESCLAMGRARGMIAHAGAGLEWYDRAMALSPSHAWAFGQSACTRACAEPELALEHADLAFSLSPRDPLTHSFHAAKAVAYYYQGKLEEAADWATKAQEIPHSDLLVMITGIGTNYRVGRIETAQRIVDRLRVTHPHVTVAGIARATPMMSAEQSALLRESLNFFGIA